jgi:hypothetical protein
MKVLRYVKGETRSSKTGNKTFREGVGILKLKS